MRCHFCNLQTKFCVAFFENVPFLGRQACAGLNTTMCCSFLLCRRYLNKSQEDQDEDLPGLEEEDSAPELDLTVLRRRTMAAAAERRMQNQQDPAP